MNPQCKICTHAQRAEIEWALGLGWAYRVIAARYGGFSRMSLSRHRSHRYETAETVEAPLSNGSHGGTPEEYAEYAEPIKKEAPVCTRRHIDPPPEGLDVNADREHTVKLVLQVLAEHQHRSGGSMRVACEAALHRCWS